MGVAADLILQRAPQGTGGGSHEARSDRIDRAQRGVAELAGICDAHRTAVDNQRVKRPRARRARRSRPSLWLAPWPRPSLRLVPRPASRVVPLVGGELV